MLSKEPGRIKRPKRLLNRVLYGKLKAIDEQLSTDYGGLMAKKLWLVLAAGLLIQPQQSKAEHDIFWGVALMVTGAVARESYYYLKRPSCEMNCAARCAADRPGDCREMYFAFFDERGKLIEDCSFGDATENERIKNGYMMLFKGNNRRSMKVRITLGCCLGGAIQEDFNEYLKEKWGEYGYRLKAIVPLNS